MEKIPEIYDIADELYTKMLDLIVTMHENVEEVEHNKYSLEETLIEYDHFVQSVLFIVAASDKFLYDVELSFITDIVKHDNLFKNEPIIKHSDYEAEELKRLHEICFDKVKNVPYFVKLAVMNDRICDQNLIIKNPTYSEMVYDWLKRLSTYLQFVDGYVVNVENSSMKKSLNNVLEYFREKRVTYARKRKAEE